MKLLLISLIGLSVCAAHSHDLCSAQQAAIIQQQWSAAFTEDIKLSQFARAFFTKFFEQSPEASQLFDGGGDFQSLEFRAHARRLMASLLEELEHIDDSADSSLEHDEDAVLSNTTPAIKAAFQASLVETLPDFIGEEMDVAAWTTCLEDIIPFILQ